MHKKYVLYVFVTIKDTVTPLNVARQISDDIINEFEEVDRVQIRDPELLRTEFAKQLDLFLG